MAHGILNVLEEIRTRLYNRISGRHDGAPQGNQNAAGPHKGKGQAGHSLSKKEREKIKSRLVGKKSSQGVVVKRISQHAFDRIGGRKMSAGRIEKMLASTNVSPSQTGSNRSTYDIPGSRLVLGDDGTIITVMWRK